MQDHIHNTIDPNRLDHLNDPIIDHIRTDFPKLHESLTVEGTLRLIRRQDLGERVVYFYVLDREERLIGVVPTRRLLTSMPNVPIRDVMSRRIISLPHTAKVIDACEMFVQHKLLAFPVVDESGFMCGTVDAGMLTEESISFAERLNFDDIFQLIGFRVSKLRGKSAFGLFRFRFPWLVATISSGTICAMLTGLFEATLAEALVLAFFMTVVLALGESVSIQSMTVALQKLHFGPPTVNDFLGWLRQEAAATALLGMTCGLVVGAISFGWKGAADASLVISSSITAAVIGAGLIGVSIPTLLHSIHDDTKIASGPITLACADIFTLIMYFGIASFVL
ncbi:MAG TPA: magnesium transporter [Aridibacter sp.]|nr:magnesium transporter [Aridibacter sp.]